MEYAELQRAMASEQEAREGGAAAHARATAALQKQLEAGTRKRDRAKGRHDELEAAHAEQAAATAKLEKYKARIDKEMAKLDVVEHDEANREVLAKLRVLVALSDSLKAQEQQFKAGCVAEMGELEERIARLTGDGAEIITDARTRAIAEELAASAVKLDKMRLLSARKNREVASIARKLDEYPGRSELNQYQRRFAELYTQVELRLAETKQYFAQFNKLTDIKQFLNGELSLLDSIAENFDAAMASPAGKQQLLTQMEAVVASLEANCTRVQQRRDLEREKRDAQCTQHTALVEKERLYFKTVREYEKEMTHNEAYTARLERKRNK